jgi:pimeloyl-ACP methyl ester carboxylesterase
MLKRIAVATIFISTLVSVGVMCSEGTQTDKRSNILYKECWFHPERDWPNASCGILTVPEDYSNPGKKNIQLPFIIFHPFKKNDEALPLLVTGGGGPGSGLGISERDAYTMDINAWYTWYSSAIHGGRSLILTDNRGVGSASPRLDCDEVEAAELKALEKGMTGNSYLEIVGRAHKDCKIRLIGNGVDLEQYSIVNAARDIDELRHNLDLKKLNLYGVSYGSRVALMYEQLFPSKTRSLILDGVYPLFVRSHQELHVHDGKTFDNFFERCSTDTVCRERFGVNLRLDFEEYLMDLEKNNITITVTIEDSLSPQKIRVTPNLLVNAIWSAMYDEYKIARLPKVIRSIISGGTDYLAEIIRDEVIWSITTGSMDEGAYALYSCHDEIPFSDIDLAISEANKDQIQKYLNVDYLRSEQQMCQIWGRNPADELLKEPVPPSAPTLIYSGELDPVTPPVWAEKLHNMSIHSWIITWPNIGHGVMSASACADWVAADFLMAPDKNPSFLKCVNEKTRFIYDI